MDEDKSTRISYSTIALLHSIAPRIGHGFTGNADPMFRTIIVTGGVYEGSFSSSSYMEFPQSVIYVGYNGMFDFDRTNWFDHIQRPALQQNHQTFKFISKCSM